MVDTKGFATDDEVRDSLGRMVLPDSEGEGGIHALSQVKKVVACGGVVKIWILKEIGPNAAKAVHDHVMEIAGVQGVTLVPLEADEPLPKSNL